MRAAKGKRWHGEALTVQASAIRVPLDPTASDAKSSDFDTTSSDPERRQSPRVGFTLTRKVGCAVVRNRARRRLREAVRLSPDLPFAAGRDYVIIGREAALRLPFEDLKRELAQAVRGATQVADRRPGRAGQRGSKRDATKP